uniref:G-protein coupled receptors family 1 profile domain-containing protein n=1 Tax=Knipowitschia caucasica TaxID=637954 RepID=A0AAV2JUW2_KNICA
MCLNNTSSECRRDTVQGLAYTIIFILGMLLQIGFFHGFFSKRGSWTDTHIYMFNLAVADSTHIFFLPFRIYDDIYECLPKTFLCTFLFNMHYLNMYASILTTAAVSVHRHMEQGISPLW